MNLKRIIVEYRRDGTWVAKYDRWGPGLVIGHGLTPEEAVRDLTMNRIRNDW